MSDNDKMRQEFEAWAKLKCRLWSGEYWTDDANLAWNVWQAAYQAARKAAQREAEEWSKSVNKSYIETANKLGSER